MTEETEKVEEENSPPKGVKIVFDIDLEFAEIQKMVDGFQQEHFVPVASLVLQNYPSLALSLFRSYFAICAAGYVKAKAPPILNKTLN